MKHKLALLLALAALLGLGCSGGSSSTDEAISGTFSDTELLSEAEAAANEVIRNASDCDAVSASFRPAMDKLDEVESKLQTETGRTTLGMLRKQVTTTGDACGVR